jgi:pimeloyl-ACP methyl ester carboxylesterase
VLGLERQLVYFPDRTHLRTPASLGLDFQDVWLTAADGVRLHAWWIPGAGPNTALILHGNAGNISFRLGEIALIATRLRVNVFLLDYRGYGLSEGRPSERGTRLDAEAAARYVTNELGVKPRQLVYFGRSLGGAVATQLAARRPPAALVLESPLPSVMRMTRASYPWLAPVVTPLFLTRYDTLRAIRHVRAPVFVAHGDQDEAIPFELGREVFEAAPDPKVWYPVVGGGHNDMAVVGGAAYFDAIDAFISTHVR